MQIFRHIGWPLFLAARHSLRFSLLDARATERMPSPAPARRVAATSLPLPLPEAIASLRCSKIETLLHFRGGWPLGLAYRAMACPRAYDIYPLSAAPGFYYGAAGAYRLPAAAISWL